MEEDDIIKEGKYVVVQKVGGEQYRVVRFTKKQRILVEKLRFDCDGLAYFYYFTYYLDAWDSGMECLKCQL